MTDRDLLTQVIGSETLAMQVLEQYPIYKLDGVSKQELKQVKGVSDKTAERIVASIELNRRIRQRKQDYTTKRIHDSKDVAEWLYEFIDMNVENFYIVTINRSMKIINIHNISKGGIYGTVCDPKIVFKLALLDNASNIILCHNHPSNCVEPSETDKSLTTQLKTVGDYLKLNVLDHIILGTDYQSYFSFAEENLL